MDRPANVSVNLSADLLNHLRRRAEDERVPLEWLVVGLMGKTLASWNERTGRRLGRQVEEFGGLPLASNWN